MPGQVRQLPQNQDLREKKWVRGEELNLPTYGL